MPDDSFADADLAALYDLINPWGPGDDFYLDLVLSARSVLDVGCGTGTLLARARDSGHTGRLCGLDPAPGMLAQARARSDVEWILGDLGSTRWDREFDLVVMTGHAFQVLVDDDELRGSLTAIRSALGDGGRFAFETRNPLARPWERWTPDRATEITTPSGEVVRVAHDVESVRAGRVRFSETFSSPGWDRPRVSWTTLRFLDVAELSALLSEARLAVEEQYGYWDRRPLTDTSPEIITIARRV